MDKNIEELMKRIMFKKQFIEEYHKKCLERAEVFSSYKELTQYCEAKIDAYNSIIDDFQELFPAVTATTQEV